jgi:hypothetical protein
VAELVDHNHDADQDDERDDSYKSVMIIKRDDRCQKVMKKISHNCAVISLIKQWSVVSCQPSAFSQKYGSHKWPLTDN